MKLRQGNVFTPVCHSVHGWGGLPHPPQADTPGQITPALWAGTPLCSACWNMVNKWAVRILLECILIITCFTKRVINLGWPFVFFYVKLGFSCFVNTLGITYIKQKETVHYKLLTMNGRFS